MMDYTIANEFTLPTKGLVYKREIPPHVKLRSMTTADEMKRLNHSERPYKQMSDVIDDCIIDPIGISAYDLAIPDYQFLLHKLRIVTYGSAYKSSSRCPFCGTDNLNTIDLENDLTLSTIDIEEYNKYSEITLPVSNHRIKLRMQSPRMIDDITLRSKEMKRNNPQIVGDPAFLLTIQSLIDTVDDKKYQDYELDPFVRKLAMADTNYILKSAQKLNESIGLGSTLVHTCSFCGLDYISNFRITAEFFGPSID